MKKSHNSQVKGLMSLEWKNLETERAYSAVKGCTIGALISICILMFLIISYTSNQDGYNTKQELSRVGVK